MLYEYQLKRLLSNNFSWFNKQLLYQQGISIPVSFLQQHLQNAFFDFYLDLFLCLSFLIFFQVFLRMILKFVMWSCELVIQHALHFCVFWSFTSSHFLSFPVPNFEADRFRVSPNFNRLHHWATKAEELASKRAFGDSIATQHFLWVIIFLLAIWKVPFSQLISFFCFLVIFFLLTLSDSILLYWFSFHCN